jgi:hypothetical protein
MKKVVDNFIKSSFKLFGKPIVDEKKQTIINLTTAFYKKIQKKTKEVNMGPKIKYETSEIISSKTLSSETTLSEMASSEMASNKMDLSEMDLSEMDLSEMDSRSKVLKCKKKKKTNETAGMSCEKAICISNNDKNESKICIDRCDEELVKKLVEPFTQFQKDNSISTLTYTGYSDNKTDFVDVNGKTYSIKSNIRKNGKVCPQVIGQPTKRKFIENVYNPINNLEQDTSISETDIKQNFFKYTDQYLNLYFQYLFCCDYIIHIFITEKETENASDFQFKFKLIDKMKFTFEKDKITFSNTCENWKEGITIKYDNVSIGEFQLHRNRDSIKFRFIIDNLLTFLK